MKNSLIILSFFSLGILIGYLNLDIEFLYNPKTSLIILYFLLILVGVGIGAEIKILKYLKKNKLKLLLLPLTVIIGTFIGVGIYGIFAKSVSLKDSLAIGAGFGYYSLSSILISQISGEIPGTIALVTNIIREIFTFIFTPLLVKYFGQLAPIASGGATSMDTSLPIITKFTGKEYAVISIYNGVVLSILVPILITFIYSL